MLQKLYFTDFNLTEFILFLLSTLNCFTHPSESASALFLTLQLIVYPRLFTALHFPLKRSYLNDTPLLTPVLGVLPLLFLYLILLQAHSFFWHVSSCVSVGTWSGWMCFHTEFLILSIISGCWGFTVLRQSQWQFVTLDCSELAAQL